MLAEPLCSRRKCKYLLGANDEADETKQRPICVAFPEGIPDEIAYGTNPHTKPYPGDNGIQYEEETDP